MKSDRQRITKKTVMENKNGLVCINPNWHSALEPAATKTITITKIKNKYQSAVHEKVEWRTFLWHTY